MANSLRLRLTKRMKVAKGPVVLGRPVVSADGIYVGTWFQKIVRIHAATFAIEWEIPAGRFEPLRECDGVVFLHNVTEGRIRGVEGASGKVLWTLRGSGGLPYQGRYLMLDKEGFSLRDLRTGKALERHQLKDVKVTDLLGDLVLYVTKTQDRCVGVYDLSRSETVWERPLYSELQRRYGIHKRGLSVYAASEQRLVATPGGEGLFGCSLWDGEIVWQVPVKIPYYFPNIHQGRVYVLTEAEPMGPPARFICVDGESGEIVYDVNQEVVTPSDLLMRGSTFGQHIAFTSRYGLIALFRMSDGALVWSYRHKSEVWGTAALGSKLLATTGDGQLLVLEGSAPL